LRGSLRQHKRTIAEAEKLANGDAGKIDKPFWKLERCERQLSNLGWRIVFLSPWRIPSPDASKHTALHAARKHD
jgi:hypothetical protein